MKNAKKGVKESSSEYPENITGVKMPLLKMPKFSGNVLEWSGFYEAFVATVDLHYRLSNVQNFTHLKSCLYGRVYKCIEGYSVINDNNPKAFAFWTQMFVSVQTCQVHFEYGCSRKG